MKTEKQQTTPGAFAVVEKAHFLNEHQPDIILGALVELFAEARDVNTVLTERRADRRRRIGLTGLHLQLDHASYFLSHGNNPPQSVVTRNMMFLPRPACR